MTAGTRASAVVRGIRRAAIIVIVIALVAAAGLGIAALLIGEFGRTQQRVLLTTLAVAGFGLALLCHLSIAGRTVRRVGYLGILVTVGALVPALVLIWVDEPPGDVDDWFKALAVLTVATVSLAQSNLLLLLASRRHALVRAGLVVTLVAVVVVAVMIVLPILTDGDIPGEHGDTYWRWFGVAAILDGLGTIALPVLGAVLREPGRVRTRLAFTLPAGLAARIEAAADRTGHRPEDVVLGILEAAPDLREPPADAPAADPPA